MGPYKQQEDRRRSSRPRSGCNVGYVGYTNFTNFMRSDALIAEVRRMYREVISAPVHLRVLGGAVAVLGVGLMVGGSVVAPDAVVIVSGVVAVLLGGSVMWSRLTVTVDDRCVSVRLRPILTIRSHLDDVVRARETSISPARLGGVGVRRARDGVRVLLLSGGRGVRIETARGGALVVQTNDPEGLLAALGTGGPRES
jgi:hypothetical protein